MIVLSVREIHKSFGEKSVLTGANLTVQEGNRIGLVGVNGSGKTTLLKLICGESNADKGTVSVKKDMRVGWLEQRGSFSPGYTVRQELEKVFEPVRAMEARLRQLEGEMAAAAGDAAALARLGGAYQSLTDDFERENGYGWQSAVSGVLAGLGFTREQQGQIADNLSGGERTRLNLCKLLLKKPELLLLDEPTNHLDLASVDWLERFLLAYTGTVVLVSHDRYFLDRVCSHIAELSHGIIEQYNGNYSEYALKRDRLFESRLKAYDLQRKEIARQEAIIARYRMYNREKSIRAAESREKRLEKMERVEKPGEESAIRFSFKTARRSGEDVLMVKGLTKRFTDKPLFEGVGFHLRAGERVALIGANGTGKTTLMKCLTGEMRPDAGTVRYGVNVDRGYYDQHQANLNDNNTVLDEVWNAFPRLNQSQVRGALGLFLFSGDDVFKTVRSLSGGEKGRVALVKLMLRQDNLLLLDEPTNHLDMDSCEVLEEALAGYSGAILAISHDRYFINRFADKVCVLQDGGLAEYPGNYDNYLEKTTREYPPDDSAPGRTKTEADKEKRRMRQRMEYDKEQRQKTEALEQNIAALESEIHGYENALANPATYTDTASAVAIGRALRAARERLEAMYDEWMAYS
ncbi:MAG: ABC-F family ATP-binding cassette domain-containing protein [Clostridia bacterium]|nr:ABC-F family ATP-binding cassette domain-containing protein [Clostridia bacterium]